MTEYKTQPTWAVYIHISPSGKRYIGITSMKPIKRRWANGKGYGHNKYFARSIEKYGWENFDHRIFAENLSEKEAKELEISLIAKYRTNNRDFGYNITIGGDGCTGVTQTPEQRYAHKIATSKPVYQFDKSLNYIKEFIGVREAAKALGNVSKSSIRECCVGKLNHAYGYIWRYKADVENPFDKNCIPQSTSLYNNRPIYKIDVITKEYYLYSSISDACKNENLEYGYIYKCCKDKAKSHNGCLWKFADTVEDIEVFISNNDNFKIGRKKSVNQYDLNGTLISNFSSMTEAAQKLNINRKKIAAACNHDIDSYNGFFWEYC